MAAHLRDLLGISIHAPYAGRDVLLQRGDKLHGISIHAPHAGRDVILNPIPQEVALFQSTRPVRGATSGDFREIPEDEISIHAPRAGRDSSGSTASVRPSVDFNPRAPCGARRVGGCVIVLQLGISIHAPRAGRDLGLLYLLERY